MKDPEWSDVEAMIDDLRRDGYRPTDLQTNTSEPRPRKALLLRVERFEGDGER